jgi:hypothetical protein
LTDVAVVKLVTVFETETLVRETVKVAGVTVGLAVNVGDGGAVAVLVSVIVAVTTMGVVVGMGLALAAEMLVAII